MKDYLPLIESGLAESMDAPGIPEKLRRSMEYTLKAGGKRIRPSMCLAACELAGSEAAVALPLACGVELIHTYSLIHDDLPSMDNDPMRRGRPSNHIVFGEAEAVLAGDALLTHAFEWMLSRGDITSPGYVRAALEIARGAGASGMVAGQSLDIEDGARTADELRRIDALKTGALIRAAIRAGAVAGGADEATVDALSRYAESYGLLFQITDDLIDASEGETGGYPSAIGTEETRALANQCASEALRALGGFGERAVFFRELTEKTLLRSE